MKLFIIAAVLASSAAARAQETGAPEDKKKDKAKDEAKDEDELDIEGRVFVRSTLSELDTAGNDPLIHDLSLASARLTADYRRGKTFKVVIEAEFANNDLDLKDVFVRARLKKDLHLIAGQFKKPISPIALESAWRLPMVERGLLGDLDSASTAPALSSVPLPFGGRGIGVGAEMDIEGNLPVQVTAAVFDHSITDDTPIDTAEAVALDPFLRGRIEPAPEVRFGATVALITHRNRSVQTSQGIDHAPLASLDAEVERGLVKVWLETFLGGSTVRDTLAGDGVAQGTMYGARGLVALRVDDLAPWLLRLEPFVAGSFIDPHLDIDSDHGLQGATGVALLFHERLRFQVEVEATRMADSYQFLGQQSRLVLYTQLGGVF